MDKYLTTLAEESLEMALRGGASQVRVVVNEAQIDSYSLLDGELEKLQHSFSSSLYFQLFVETKEGTKYGTFSTNMMDKTLIQKWIDEAIISTKLLAPDTHRALPAKELYFKGSCPDLGQCDPKYPTISPESKRELLDKIGAEIDRSDKRIISVANDYEDFREEVLTLDSQGFCGFTSGTLYSLSTECSVKGKGDIRPQNFWFDSSMFFDELPLGCGKTALERTLGMLGAKKIKSGKYHAVIDRTVASKLVSPIFTALSGASIYMKKSFLYDTLPSKGVDKKSHNGSNTTFNGSILGEKLTIRDTPHIPGLMGSRWFDSEGIATQERDIILHGVPQIYFLNTYFGNKLGMTPTVESISVPSIAPLGQQDSASMMKDLNRGIFVTGFNGGNCNPSTGDFSFGIEGYLFENGKISHPIKEMNMTGNIINLWNNIIHIGTDFRKCSRWQIPSLAFSNIDFNGL